MTDSDFLYSILSDGKPHSTNEIIQASQTERGCGLMVHSRAADLRKNGHYIVCDCVGRKNGRPTYEYRLLGSLPEGDHVMPETFGGLAATQTPATSPSESEPTLFETPRKPAWA